MYIIIKNNEPLFDEEFLTYGNALTYLKEYFHVNELNPITEMQNYWIKRKEVD